MVRLSSLLCVYGIHVVDEMACRIHVPDDFEEKNTFLGMKINISAECVLK